MVDWNGAYIHPAYETHRKLKCTSPFCGRVDNIATGVTDTCSMCSSSMIPIDEIKCPSCGREMYNDNCLWCEDPEMVICPGRLDEKGKLRHVCKEDCSHPVPHERRNECDVHNEPFCSPCIPVEIVDGDPDEENRLCYTKSCPKWFDDICRNSTGCADCSTRTTEPPTGNLEIENAAEIENGPKIVHGGVTFESSDREPEKDDDCPHNRHGNEMFNGRPRTKCWDCDEWLEPDFDSDMKDRLDIGNNDCLCDKEPVVWPVEVGHGELNWVCPDCKKIYGNWKPIWLRKEKDCWLCGGTGSVMMDRQTGAMFGKEPSIDWATKDCWERQCPNCGVGTESTIKVPKIVASEIERHVTEDVLYESIEDFVLSALRAEISLARRNPPLQEDQEGGE